MISSPGRVNSPCGRWGCGAHGTCSNNNTCVCQDGWSGVYCHIIPEGGVDPKQGDKTCGNWGVQGKLILSSPGYAPMCDCSSIGTRGKHCEIECESDAECGTGTCDVEVKRCFCDIPCDECFGQTTCAKCAGLGACVNDVCSHGWSGIKCMQAKGSECVNQEDCMGGGTCTSGKCVCDAEHTGLRCEKLVVSGAQKCAMDSDCNAATDTCTSSQFPDQRPCYPNCPDVSSSWCSSTGFSCSEDSECAAKCVNGSCLAQADPEPVDTMSLDDKIMTVLNYLVTLDGMAQVVSEEVVEEILHSLSKNSVALIRASAKKMAERAVKRKAQVMVANRVASFSAKQTLKKSAKTLFFKKVGKLLANSAIKKGISRLYFILEVASIVLDVDDAAGFNAQLNQSFVDNVIKKFYMSVNERGGKYKFPMQYYPEYTLEWLLESENEVKVDERMDLANDYLKHLVVNSNGQRITSYVPEPTSLGEFRNEVLWKIAGERLDVYLKLEKWGWLIIVSVVVGVIVVVVGAVLGVAHHRKKNRP